MASEIDDRIKQPTTRENVLFYVTAFFCLVAVFSVFIFLFLVPFFIEPALATIYMEFDPEPVVCQTTEATFHRGLSNCPWSSCREGCTKEVYECWHIRVRYRSNVPVGLADSRSVRDRIAQHKTPSSTPPAPLKQNVNYKSVHHAAGSRRDTPTDVDRIQSVLPDDTEPADDEDEDLDSGDDAAFALSDEGGDGLHVHEARLQPNVKGCGYPPDVECNNTFAPAYGVVGANFSCFYSLVDPTLAITQLNIDKVHSDLIYCLTVPIICFLISVVYLLYAYFKLYADDPNGPGTISQGVSGALVSGIPEFDADGNLIVADRPVNSPSRLAGKYGILFQAHPSPDGKRPSSRVVRRARSGGAITMPVRAAHFETRAVAREAMIPFDGTRVPRPKPTDADRGGMRISKSMGARFGECSAAAQEGCANQRPITSSTSSIFPMSRESSRSPSPSFSSSASSPSSRWSSTSARYPVSPDSSHSSLTNIASLASPQSHVRSTARSSARDHRGRTESIPLLENDD